MQKTAETSPALTREFGLCETITITVGTVIGVGLFTVGANVVGILGPWVILATFAAMAVSIYPAMLYAEMSASLPLSGGTYQYASYGLGRAFGVLAGWSFLISLISVASGEALAFSFYLRTLVEALGLSLPLSDPWIAAIAVAVFLFLGIRGVRLTGRMQNGFMFFFWGVSIVWLIAMIPRLNISSFAFPTAATALTPDVFFPCVALVWWCFAGFETCCAMSAEIRFPQVNLPRALRLAPLIVFAVNGAFQWVLACIVPPESLPALAQAMAPYAEGMRLAGILGFPLILLCAGIAFGGDFSTLNASLTAPARYLYAMAEDGILPRFLARLHSKFHTPFVAIGILGAVTILLICTGSILYIASLSLFSTLLYYMIGIASAWGLRRKFPSLPRPYRARALALGAPVSILVYLAMMTQLERQAVFAGFLWSVLGLVLYWICKRRYHPAPPLALPELSGIPVPTREEQRLMDREYRIWRAVVVLAASAVLLLFLFSFVLF